MLLFPNNITMSSCIVCFMFVCGHVFVIFNSGVCVLAGSCNSFAVKVTKTCPERQIESVEEDSEKERSRLQLSEPRQAQQVI